MNISFDMDISIYGFRESSQSSPRDKTLLCLSRISRIEILGIKKKQGLDILLLNYPTVTELIASSPMGKSSRNFQKESSIYKINSRTTEACMDLRDGSEKHSLVKLVTESNKKSVRF